MICSNCHQDNVDHANYCKYCGTLYPHRQSHLDERDIAIKKNQQKRNITAIIIIVTAIVYIILEVFIG